MKHTAVVPIVFLFTSLLCTFLATPIVQAQNSGKLPPGDAALLTPDLVWHVAGNQSDQLSIDGQTAVDLNGTAYDSEPVAQKLPERIIAFYSPEHLSESGWRYLGDSAGALMVIRIFYEAPNRYLTIRMGSCTTIGVSATQAQEQVALPAGNCLRVWISDSASSAPVPPESAFATAAPPAAPVKSPVSPAYPNPLVVPLYSQSDSRWKANQMGWPPPGYPNACSYSTLGYVDSSHTGYGCWTTSYTMLYDYYSPNYITPPDLNTRLNTGSGGGPRYAGYSPDCNNLMPGGAPYAPPGVSRGKTYYNYCATANCIDASTNTLLIDRELQAGRPLLTYVHYSGLSPQHMVVIVGHSGSTYTINDPAKGKQVTLATGGVGPYIVDWIYVWQGTPSTSLAANFAAAPTVGASPLGVVFTDTSVGNVTRWLWSFGDTVTSTAQHTTHVYTETGPYTVSLTVAGPDGSNTLNRPNRILVAAFTVYVPVIGALP